MTCGIYKLNFSGTSKVYIGQSINIENRIIRHKYLLQQGVASKKLQQAYNDFGSPNHEILLECLAHELDDNENAAIEVWNSVTLGFNSLEIAGINGSISSPEHFNCKYSEDQILKILDLLTSSNVIDIKSIADITGTTVSTVRHISNLETHFWLAEAEPDKYDVLFNRKQSGFHGLSAEAKGIKYPPIMSPEGEIFYITNMCQFAKEHNLQQANLCNVLHGKNKSIKGWKLV